MQFANPIWLWGLTGLLIPIGIHLLSRKESRIIRIGSLRHLEASHTKQSVNLRLNELLLLAIRCLLITLLVLLLSGLQWDMNGLKNESWLLIERGMEVETEFLSIQDSLKSQGFKVKYLEDGFPEINSEKGNVKLSYWNLIEKLKATPLEKIVVLSYGYVEGFIGKRISVPSNLTWISLNPSPILFPVSAIRASNDSIKVREATSSANETIFNTVPHASTQSQRSFTLGTDTVHISNKDTISVTFVTDPEFNYDRQILEASLRAVEAEASVAFNIRTVQQDKWNSTNPENSWLIWLSLKDLPSSINTNCILFREINYSNRGVLETKAISGNMRWVITKRLNEEIALKENLPLELAFILLPKEKTQKKVAALDRRTLPENVLWSHAEMSEPKIVAAITSSYMAQILAILIFISLLAERIIAFRRNQ